ncbi:ABC transporter ATP-binding protein [Nocardiopsis sp. FIRDI 009]|uniref:ABC transporter ATP-binding protein n=1 Tax=Nocardiopsis sp. FIRDI 009 TaxID=714197 RepID=UPI001E3E9DD9|nr:ABC transporter ATP-binding protein [Nocardiopsis sp. FIRDI 009]
MATTPSETVDPREPSATTDTTTSAADAELTPIRYLAYTQEAARATWLTVGRRMPTLVAHALRLGWRANRADLLATVAWNVGTGAATAWALVMTTRVLERLFTAAPTPDRILGALPMLAVLAAAMVARGVCSTLAGRSQARLEPQVVLAAERRFNEATTSVPRAAFDSSAFNDQVFRSYARGTDEAGSLVRYTVDVLTGLVGIVAAAGVLVSLHPSLVPLLLLALVPQWWGSAAAARLRYRAMLAMTDMRRRKWLVQRMMMDDDNASEVRSYNMERVLREEFDRLGDRELGVHMDLATRTSLIRLGGDTFGGLVTLAAFVVLGVLMVRGVVPIAAGGAAVVAIRVAQGALNSALGAVSRVYESGLYFADFLDMVETARRLAPPATLPQAPAEFAAIRVEGVTFTYPGDDEEAGAPRSPALADVTLTLERGRTYALVGENGSGKSTLAKLLAGLYSPDRGRVCWDGVDLAGVDGDSLRRRIAVMAQEHTHWPMTARENVVMGSPFDPDRLDRAARATHADAVVADLPHGWETLMDKSFAQGVQPSGGQWQRLAAARAFYRADGDDVPLLIVDEPTSALDARAEYRFFSSVHEHAARTSATVVLITHRLASVRPADEVVVLDRGRVLARGSHERLLATCDHYRELWQMQASAYQEV